MPSLIQSCNSNPVHVSSSVTFKRNGWEIEAVQTVSKESYAHLTQFLNVVASKLTSAQKSTAITSLGRALSSGSFKVNKFPNEQEQILTKAEVLCLDIVEAERMLKLSLQALSRR
jgi:hypothetical protein